MLTLLCCCTGMWAEGELNGVFTISASGGKVQFSQGNLQYYCSTSTPEWRFADHQYDYVAFDGSAYAENSCKWIDLFAYGTSGYNNGQACYQPYSISGDASHYYQNALTGNADWGYNKISNGGNSNGIWRTLTSTEWRYLFQVRTDANNKYGHGSVNGIHGMIILPDEWTLPAGLTFTPGNSAWSNTYTIAEWNQMEAAGAVFLPASGSRAGDILPTAAEENGLYRSSTNAYYVNFSLNGLSVCTSSDNYYQYGDAVRLVKDYLQQDGEGNYLLGSVNDWKLFAKLVETTPAANAKMTADINLGDDQTVIGGVYNGSTLFYQGTFDGQGHTLTIAYNNTSGERFTTPFSLLEGATIKNLHLDGTVNSTYAYGGSIASILKGTNTIENVWNSVTAVCTMGGWVQMGGFIGVLESGATATISDCLYTGSITHNGGYSGYFNGGYGPKPTVNNCLVLGAFTGAFGFNGNYNNCYCKHASTTGVTQPSDENLSDGTTTTALNNGRKNGPWVQDADTGEPRLDLFMATTSVTANEGKTGEYWSTYYDGAKSSIADANTTVYTGKVNGDKIDLTEIVDKTIPAGNAVILKSTAANVTLTKTSATGTLANNDLKGVDVATAKTDVYCLSKNGTVVGFYNFSGDVPAHRAYIEIVSSAPMLGFDDGGTTEIMTLNIEHGTLNNGSWYTLDGRQLNAQPTRKGIYVRNGKKFIVK